MSNEEVFSRNPPDAWPVEATRYYLNGKIGKGAFATVYKAVIQTDSNGSQLRQCAIKVINLEHVDTNFVDIRQEVQTMRLFSHSNILPCYTSFLHHTNLWLVTQLMDKGSSSRCLASARIFYNPLNNNGVKQSWDIEAHITYILHQTILGLKYIHDNCQIHRDIKAGNILLNSIGDVKIADFGVSGWLVQGGAHRENTRTFVGTPCWMAPEVMEQVHGYDTKADLWSLGITALELAFGYAPYAKYPPMKVLLKTIQEDPPSFSTYYKENDDDDEWLNPRSKAEDWSDSFRDMISWCLQKNPKNRPNCDELLVHKHFQSLKDVSISLEYKTRIREEVLDKIPDVGTEDTDNICVTSVNFIRDNDKSDIPVTIVTENNEETRRTSWLFPEVSEKRASGTTWIFSEGSNVSVSADEALGRKEKDKEDLDFFDQFEKETQGEHFKHPSRRNSENSSNKHENQIQNTSETEDDINAFMDQFEQETGGEDYRRSRKFS